MPRKNFHAKDKPFDEGTLTKLDIFQLYTREWLPVFLARQPVIFPEIHIYDFFCGPGVDAVGTKGSPIRIIDELIRFKQYLTGGVKVHLHFYDSDADKIIELRNRVKPLLAELPHVVEDIHTMPFDQAFVAALPTLYNLKAAKLVLLDPCGVNYVTKNVFGQIITSKVTDFMFFLPSSILHRFHAVDSIPIKIDRPDDFYHVHRRTFDVFKGLKPAGLEYYMAPFSIQKKKGIYGIIFGSSNRLGMDKFLSTAWEMDPDNGEANFDIHREKTTEALSPFLSLEGFTDTKQPTKVVAFEDELEAAILAGKCSDESSIIDICFEHGVRRQHAEPVLKRLKAQNAIQCDFRVPQIDTLREIIVVQSQVVP